MHGSPTTARATEACPPSRESTSSSAVRESAAWRLRNSGLRSTAGPCRRRRCPPTSWSRRYAQFSDWLEEQHRQATPKSLFGQAVEYSRNQWASPVRYLDDARFAIDNGTS